MLLTQQEVKTITAQDLKQALNLPTVEEAIVAFRPSKWHQTDRYKALVNAESGQLYAIHTSAYRTVPHEDGLFNTLQAIGRNSEYGDVQVDISEYDGFKRLHGKLTFIDHHYEIKPGDTVNPSIEYYNSYDGSWAEKLSFGAFRVVCANGLVVGQKFMVATAPHIGQVRDQMYINLDHSLEQFSYQTGIWREWVDKELQIAHLDVLEELELNQEEHSTLVEQTEPQMDLWTFYNLITALVTHQMQSLNKRVKTWNHLRARTENW